MNSKSDSRIRRAAKTRIRISQQDKPRLSVFKSSQNLYAQVFDSTGSTVLASASTNEKADKKTRDGTQADCFDGALNAGYKIILIAQAQM